MRGRPAAGGRGGDPRAQGGSQPRDPGDSSKPKWPWGSWCRLPAGHGTSGTRLLVTGSQTGASYASGAQESPCRSIGADASCWAQGRGQNAVPSPALETFLPPTGSTPSSIACFRPLPPRPHTLVTAWDPVSPPDGRCLAASWVWLRPARHLQYPVHGCFWFCGNPRLSSRLSANVAAWRGPFPVPPPPPWTDLPHPDPKTPCAFPTAWMTSALCTHGPFPVTLTMFPSTAAVHVPLGLQASGSPTSVAPVARGPPVPGPWTVPPRRACLRRSLGSDRLLSPFSPSRLIVLDREEKWFSGEKLRPLVRESWVQISAPPFTAPVTDGICLVRFCGPYTGGRRQNFRQCLAHGRCALWIV